MCDHPNYNFKTEPVDDVLDLLQQSKNGNGLNSATNGAFEEWLIEYRKWLPKILQDRTNNINSS